MGVQLNIKNEEARQLAEEAAHLTGVSITQAVVNALRRDVGIHRCAQSSVEERARDKENGFYDLIEGSREMWKGRALSIDHGDLLYDEWGLPR